MLFEVKFNGLLWPCNPILEFRLYVGGFRIFIQLWNLNSDLYRDHHDWVMAAYGKPSWIAKIF